MDIITKEMKKARCDNIEKNITVKINGEKIKFDFVGYINDDPIVGIDVTEGEEKKGIGKLSLISQSDKINYYGIYNKNTEKWNWYQLLGGNISSINKVPVLQNKVDLSKIKSWFERTVLENIYNQESFSIQESNIAAAKILFYKLEVEKGNYNYREFSEENIKQFYSKLSNNNDYKIDNGFSLSSKTINTIAERFDEVDLSRVSRKDILFILDEVLRKQSKSQNSFLVSQVITEIPQILISKNSKVKRILDGHSRIGQLLTVCKSTEDNINVFGIEKNPRLIKLAQLRSMILKQRNNFLTGDSLYLKAGEIEDSDQLPRSFDLIASIPPFGVKIRDKELLNHYDITDRSTAKAEELYIELYLSFLETDGYLAIVLPEGILTNNRDKSVREYIIENSIIKAIISLPPEIYKPATALRSSMVILKKKIENEEQKDVFMATPDDIDSLKTVIKQLEDWEGLI